MRMNQNEKRFDFHGLGLALKKAREEKGWTQAYVAELVDRDSRTIMNIENKGQYPSFDLFVKLITMFDVSVDQFIHADGGARSSSCRKHIDVLLNSMNEKELVVIEATAEGIKKARETEVPEYDMYPLYWTPSRGGIIMRYTYEYKRISIYLLFFGMKKGAQLFSQAPVGSSSFLRHDTKIPPVVSFGRYFV